MTSAAGDLPGEILEPFLRLALGEIITFQLAQFWPGPITYYLTSKIALAFHPSASQQLIPAFAKSSFRPLMLMRLEASGVPAPRQCVSGLTA